MVRLGRLVWWRDSAQSVVQSTPFICLYITRLQHYLCTATNFTLSLHGYNMIFTRLQRYLTRLPCYLYTATILPLHGYNIVFSRLQHCLYAASTLPLHGYNITVARLQHYLYTATTSSLHGYNIIFTRPQHYLYTSTISSVTSHVGPKVPSEIFI